MFDGLRSLFDRLPVPTSLTADDEDAQIWYKTTQIYVADIRRSCVERLESENGGRMFRLEAERGAEIVGTRRGAGKRVGASDELLGEMERAEILLSEAADGYADENRLFDQLESVERMLSEECP